MDRTSAPTFAQAWNLVRSTARRLGVPPDLALAVAFQESGLQQREVSPTDAVGIMQIEPYTANWLSAYTGRRIDRFDAASNVYAGTDLLRLLLGEAPRREAIAGYKVPKTIEFRSEPLPLSGAMKVLKHELRAPYWAGRERTIN